MKKYQIIAITLFTAIIIAALLAPKYLEHRAVTKCTEETTNILGEADVSNAPLSDFQKLYDISFTICMGRLGHER